MNRLARLLARWARDSRLSKEEREQCDKWNRRDHVKCLEQLYLDEVWRRS